MAYAANEFCWLVTDDNFFHWINDAPKLLMLIICTVLLCHIVFNIWTALKNQNDIQHSAMYALIRVLVVIHTSMPLERPPTLNFYPNFSDVRQRHLFCACRCSVYHFCSLLAVQTLTLARQNKFIISFPMHSKAYKAYSLQYCTVTLTRKYTKTIFNYTVRWTKSVDNFTDPAVLQADI